MTHIFLSKKNLYWLLSSKSKCFEGSILLFWLFMDIYCKFSLRSIISERVLLVQCLYSVFIDSYWFVDLSSILTYQRHLLLQFVCEKVTFWFCKILQLCMKQAFFDYGCKKWKRNLTIASFAAKRIMPVNQIMNAIPNRDQVRYVVLVF